MELKLSSFSQLQDGDNFQSLQESVMMDLGKSQSDKQDNIIRAALLKNGFNPDDTKFLAANIQRIMIEGDPYDHFYFNYGQPDEKRIISIERDVKIDLATNIENFSTTIRATQKYY